MPYVERDSETNSVKGVYANSQPGYAEEFLTDDDEDVVAFLTPPVVTEQETDTLGKLKSFIADNPDVKILLGI